MRICLKCKGHVMNIFEQEMSSWQPQAQALIGPWQLEGQQPSAKAECVSSSRELNGPGGSALSCRLHPSAAASIVLASYTAKQNLACWWRCAAPTCQKQRLLGEPAQAVSANCNICRVLKQHQKYCA